MAILPCRVKSEITHENGRYTLTLSGLTLGAITAIRNALTVWSQDSIWAFELLQLIRACQMPADEKLSRVLDARCGTDKIPTSQKTLARYKALRAHLSSNGGLTEDEIDEIADRPGCFKNLPCSNCGKVLQCAPNIKRIWCDSCSNNRSYL